MPRLAPFAGLALACSFLPGVLAAPTAAFVKDVQAVTFRVPDPARLHLFLRDAQGALYGSLPAVRTAVASSGRTLRFAMNAGMFEADQRPAGLFIAEGREIAPLNTAKRPPPGRDGNFYLRPNGVFVVSDAGPAILTTDGYAAMPPARARIATQSGPILLMKGELAPALARGSDIPARTPARLRHTRNGVCVDGQQVTLVLVDSPLSLHQFAVYLRDGLRCRDALYFDGTVSKVLDARSGRLDREGGLGPVIGYVE